MEEGIAPNLNGQSTHSRLGSSGSTATAPGRVLDPVEAIVRCAVRAAEHTVVVGRVVIRNRHLMADAAPVVRRHKEIAAEWAGPRSPEPGRCLFQDRPSSGRTAIAEMRGGCPDSEFTLAGGAWTTEGVRPVAHVVGQAHYPLDPRIDDPFA